MNSANDFDLPPSYINIQKVVEFRANAHTAEFGIRVEFAEGLTLVRRALLRRILLWAELAHQRDAADAAADAALSGSGSRDVATPLEGSGYAEGHAAWERARRELGLASSAVDAIAEEVASMAAYRYPRSDEVQQRSVSVGGTVARWIDVVARLHVLHRQLH